VNRYLAAMIAVFAALFLGSAQAQELPTILTGLTDEKLDQAMTFVGGNERFVLLHEASHLLISELSLPVLSSEEDAADTLSALIFLNLENAKLEQSLWSASAGWMMAGDESDANGDAPEYWDVHGLDKQRGYNLICLMYGSNPVRYLVSADAFNLPETRRDGCAREYQQIATGWDKILHEHMATSEKPSSFTVSYEPTDNPLLSYFAEYAKENKLLEMVDELLTNTFALKPGIRLTAKECGIVNAFWAPEERELTLCYELMYWHAGLITKKIRE
jgi:Putative metallopeptidase